MREVLKSRIIEIINELARKDIEYIANYDAANEMELSKNKSILQLSLDNTISKIPEYSCENIEQAGVLEKICWYYISGEKNKNGKKDTNGYKLIDFDYDVSLYNLVIWGLLFDDITEEKYLNPQRYAKINYEYVSLDSDYSIRGDTMNSVNTTLDNYFKMLKRDIPKGRKRYPFFLANVEKISLSNQLLPESLIKFLEVSHTIGNFILVPFRGAKYGEFNRPRGLWGSTQDYWDLTLLCIYKWYETTDEKWIRKIIGSKDKDVKLCIEWLNTFGEEQDVKQCKWKCFVKKNYMQSFVNCCTEEWQPKELWDGHFRAFVETGNALPQKEEHYEKFFTNAHDWIRTRGKQIAEGVKDILNQNDINTLANKILNSNQHRT